MRTLLLLGLVACSSAPESVDSQAERWPNYCHFQYLDVNLEYCSTFTHFYCNDGDSQYLWIPAEGSLWLGTPCITTPEQTYVYVCVNDTTTGWAEVRCSK